MRPKSTQLSARRSLVALIRSVDIGPSLVIGHPGNTTAAVVAVLLATAVLGDVDEGLDEVAAPPASDLFPAGAADVERVPVCKEMESLETNI